MAADELFPPGTEPFYDDNNNLVALGSDGLLYEVDEDIYAAELQRGQWMEEASNNADLLEHRLGRELTGAEQDALIEDMETNGHTDAVNSYLVNFSEDRTRDDDDRQALMKEYAEDAWAEAQEQDAADEGEAE